MRHTKIETALVEVAGSWFYSAYYENEESALADCDLAEGEAVIHDTDNSGLYVLLTPCESDMQTDLQEAMQDKIDRDTQVLVRMYSNKERIEAMLNELEDAPAKMERALQALLQADLLEA